MYGDRGSAVLSHPAQWHACAHRHTALVPGGGVELSWTFPAESGAVRAPGCPDPSPPNDPCDGGGLAFDQACRAYRSFPASGRVEVQRPGDATGAGCPGPYRLPRALAVDDRDRLYVAEYAARTVAVVDLTLGRLLRRVPVGPGRPVDLLACGGRVLALTTAPSGLLWLEGRRGARPGPALRPPCPDRDLDGVELRPTRIASGPLVLWTGRGRALITRVDGTVELEVPDATDLVVDRTGMLVLSRGPGAPFRRFGRESGGWLEIEPVGAPGFDGGGIAVTPAGRIAYTTTTGYATTTGTAARRVTTGTVTTYRFDSGNYRTRWGRMFLDGCLPPHTSVTARFVTTDDDEVPDPAPWTAPTRTVLGGGPTHRELYPPLPSLTQLDAAPVASAIFRRPTGSEQPWLTGRDATFEAPVRAAPGRYLWIQLVLQGTTSAGPRVNALRIERPGHRLLNSLPRAWSRDAGEADFLQRYLAPVEGVLHELDCRAAERAILLNATSAPSETLDWLASFAGLVLDRRWTEASRRTLVAEAYPLFARRGTKAALARLVEIYLGRAPILVEQWQFRGLGGTVLGTRPGVELVGGPAGSAPLPAPTVGGAASTSGTLGRFTIGGSGPDGSSFADHAHRLTVLIPGALADEQRAVVTGLLETHRPAHVAIDLCELGSGMRVGHRLHLSLTSFVGPGAAWQPAMIGRTGLGTDATVGSGAVGDTIGTAVAGRVRVG